VEAQRKRYIKEVTTKGTRTAGRKGYNVATGVSRKSHIEELERGMHYQGT